MADSQFLRLRILNNMRSLKYNDGQPIQLGDEIDYNGQTGKIVIVAGNSNGLGNFKPKEWESEVLGVLIQFTNGALLQISNPFNDKHLHLIKSGNNRIDRQ